jgi:hypothetical protein
MGRRRLGRIEAGFVTIKLGFRSSIGGRAGALALRCVSERVERVRP